jgi:hypothetical protein
MAKQAATGARTATPAKKRSQSIVPSTTPTPQVSEPSYEQIAARAYALYAARGFREGDALNDWVTAEQQLRSAG